MDNPSYKRKTLMRRRAYKPAIRFATVRVKSDLMKSLKQTRKKDQTAGKTNIPGQNPKQNDSPQHDENNDQNRTNQYGREYAS
jgi:hypothetical protein